VIIISPLNGQYVSKAVSIMVSASDNIGVTKAELFVDGAFTAASSTAPFTTKWNAKRVRSGAHTLQVRVHDAAGNTATSQVITVYR
jgi:hypothetical protein